MIIIDEDLINKIQIINLEN